jgi:flagellar motor protein MotB
MRTRQGIVGEEQHASTERYIITYADLITLLLGLFVILYAASQVDLGKYREVAQALVSYFRTGSVPLPLEQRGKPCWQRGGAPSADSAPLALPHGG